MADNMMRIAGRDIDSGVAKALSTILDPNGNGVLLVHESAPWFVVRDLYGNILDLKADPDGTLRVNNCRPQFVAIVNITCTSANTEYLIQLPTATKRFRITIRDGLSTNKYRIAYVSGKVSTPVSPYLSFTQDKEYSVDSLDLETAVLYIASTTAGAVAQLEAWY